MLHFQNIILTLQTYWAQHGCALLQPYDMEVGAGTSHTATFLRALGPEPWRFWLGRAHVAAARLRTGRLGLRLRAGTGALHPLAAASGVR